MLFYLISFLVLLIDQALKFLVRGQMTLGQSLSLFRYLKLTYVRNTGAAFSIFVGFSPYLALVGAVIVVAILYFYHRTKPQDLWLRIGLALVLGGSLGNLADRIFHGYVIDYIDVTVWPVFNFADAMINVGVALIALRLFIRGKRDVSDTA